MKLFGALLLMACLAAGRIDAAAQGRILGGEEALTSATPYAISLRIDNAHVCGASILSQTKLLTAAHCIFRDNKQVDVSRLSGRVGSTNQYAGGSIVYVASVTPHPDYFKLQNNLAIVTLSAPLTWTDRIQPIELIGKDEPLPEDGAAITVSGWGTNSEGLASYKIRELKLSFAANAVCQDAYSDHDAANSFCLAHALKEGTCYGDGGGAAVYNGKLLGISNFVVGACGSRYPDVFVRISGYADWLQQQLLN